MSFKTILRKIEVDSGFAKTMEGIDDGFDLSTKLLNSEKALKIILCLAKRWENSDGFDLNTELRYSFEED